MNFSLFQLKNYTQAVISLNNYDDLRRCHLIYKTSRLFEVILIRTLTQFASHASLTDHKLLGGI